MKTAILIFSLFILNNNLKSQTIFESNQVNGKLIIKGTSTLHDWESIVEEFSVKADIAKEGMLVNSIADIVMTATVKSIKSGKGIMDGKTYEALKEEKFSTIIFKGQSQDIKENIITVIGEMTIAGVTKQISLTTTLTANGNDLSFIGSKDLLMSDYGISPPVAVFGTIKTGDQITIEYKFNFKQIIN
jgi:hypothetical protein